MPIITLTTDWNEDDYYIGSVKGAIISQVPNVKIIDISHKIKPFNILQAAFILRNSFPHFPKNTIHIIGVNTEPEKKQKNLVIYAEGHYFIGTDNGIFSLIFQNHPKHIIELETKETPFPALDSFVHVASRLAMGDNIESMGKKVNDFQKKVPLRATIDENVITGSIIHIDSYKNAITNISRDLFERIGKNRLFELFVQSNSYKIQKINTTYNETSPGELLALFNSLNLLEVAINKGNAADLLNLSTNSTIRIKFH